MTSCVFCVTIIKARYKTRAKTTLEYYCFVKRSLDKLLNFDPKSPGFESAKAVIEEHVTFLARALVTIIDAINDLIKFTTKFQIMNRDFHILSDGSLALSKSEVITSGLLNLREEPF